MRVLYGLIWDLVILGLAFINGVVSFAIVNPFFWTFYW